MAMVPGLSPNIRLVQPESMADLEDIIIEAEDEPSKEVRDASGNLLEIEHPDGSLTISLDGKPIEEAESETDKRWFRNLVDDIDQMILSGLANDILRGIGDDLISRQDWIDSRATGIRLLGLDIEVPGTQGSSDGAPVEGMSKVRHPLLLEATLRFQANARSELLPTDGPVKIRNDTNNSTIQDDQLANALQKDMNHYLTSIAKEYYPDTDKMLFLLGFGGSAFKKVYNCPLRNRPVSETVDADDLIVNNSATDLSNAKRITHRIWMKPSTVKRMQLIGAYKDVDLGTPRSANLDEVQREKANQQGIQPEAINPEDRDREIYECYCELDIPGFEHKRRGKPTGLEIPYRVTIDVSSREVLSIVRNYKEDTADLPEPCTRFVHYLFVPGMGFYGIGLLHILGNTTNAVTAAWREMLDAGMFANFPGFLMADTGARQNTNIFRVPPGGGALVKTNGMPINQAVMPLPYKEPGAALMALVKDMSETGQRIGGIAEIAVGEGRQDAPVGTTIAMIDQATKVLNSVHKRMHTAQAEEFALMLECFKENPEAFWERNRKPSYPWDERTFMQAIEDCDLVPQADPNTASQTQRLMKVMALKQLQGANPDLYDPIAIDKAIMQAIGWNNPEQFMVPLESLQNRTPPDVQKSMAELQIKKQDADTRTMLAEAKIAETQAKLMAPAETGIDPMHAAKMADLEVKSSDAILDAHNRQADRESRERIAYANIIRDLISNPEGMAVARELLTPELIAKLTEQG